MQNSDSEMHGEALGQNHSIETLLEWAKLTEYNELKILSMKKKKKKERKKEEGEEGEGVTTSQ